jgi:hypothetical protein
MAFGTWKKVKGGLNRIGGWMKDNISTPVIDTFKGVGQVVSDALGLEANKPPKPNWGGPSETQDSFTRLMQKRNILPPWLFKH